MDDDDMTTEELFDLDEVLENAQLMYDYINEVEEWIVTTALLVDNHESAELQQFVFDRLTDLYKLRDDVLKKFVGDEPEPNWDDLLKDK